MNICYDASTAIFVSNDDSEKTISSCILPSVFFLTFKLLHQIDDEFVCIGKPSNNFSTRRKKFSMKALDPEVGVIKYNRHKCTLISLFCSSELSLVIFKFLLSQGGHDFLFLDVVLRAFSVISFQKGNRKFLPCFCSRRLQGNGLCFHA